jgi:hypothetical protein
MYAAFGDNGTSRFAIPGKRSHVFFTAFLPLEDRIYLIFPVKNPLPLITSASEAKQRPLILDSQRRRHFFLRYRYAKSLSTNLDLSPLCPQWR